MQQALAVDVDGLLPLLHVGVGHHGEVHDASHGDEDVHWAKLGLGGFHERLDSFAFGHISLADDDLTLADGESALHLLQSVDTTSAHGNVAALSGECSGDCSADSR